MFQKSIQMQISAYKTPEQNITISSFFCAFGWSIGLYFVIIFRSGSFISGFNLTSAQRKLLSQNQKSKRDTKYLQIVCFYVSKSKSQIMV